MISNPDANTSRSSGYSDAVDDRAGRRHLPHAPAVGVHQVHVRLVERLEVLVVEAEALAVLAVPGLQPLGGARDPRRSRRSAGGTPPSPRSRSPRARPRSSVEAGSRWVSSRRALAPAVAHQVAVGLAAGDHLGEVAGALGLPARRERAEPLLVGGPLAAHADGGRACAGRRRPPWPTGPAAGTTCTAVAPVPMMPTTLSARWSIGSVGLPPV